MSKRDAEIVIGSREQLLYLLAEAAEIEHCLMCCYLYAAFSLKIGRRAGLSSSESRLVAQWRKAILIVATEEMVHLVQVSNITVALGGRAHLTRPNFPIAPGYFPSGVVVKLAPFSKSTLDHFIFLERPAAESRVDGEGFKSEFYRRETSYVGLMPSAQDYATVGHLYEAIAENLKHFAKESGERATFIGDRRSQIGPAVLKMPGVREIVDLKSAIAAIDSIVEQGEGSRKHSEESHYTRFLTIKREYRQALSANPHFAPAWPAARSPVMRKPAVGRGKIYVDAMPAARVLDFANALYCQIVRSLAQAFGTAGPRSNARKRKLLNAAVELMHLLSIVASHLVTLRASSTRSSNAGVSFTMLRAVEPFLNGPAQERIFQERIKELIGGVPELGNLVNAAVIRRALKKLQQSRKSRA